MKRAVLLGFDFGTLSCRLTAINAASGEIILECEDKYLHGVISDVLPDGETELNAGWNLQDADDYIKTLFNLIKAATQKISVSEIIAIGIGFTNCTLVSLGADGRPLSSMDEFQNNPYAWTKLWKHHAAQPYAERIERALGLFDYELYCDCGQVVSSEWLFPKVLQIFEEAPDVYARTDLFLEAADYITYFLTGNLVRNEATLGLNAFYNPRKGFPSEDFFNSISPGWGRSIFHKMRGRILPVGSRAGYVSKEIASFTGLRQDVVVAVGHGDSEITAAGLGTTAPDSMIMVMGTSTCFQVLTNSDVRIRGVSKIHGGMIPGMFALESGQPSTGDTLSWFSENMLPASYFIEAEQQHISSLEYITGLAQAMKPGECGLVSLDWFNGNRSILMDYSLRGLIAGLSLNTTPQQIFRAFVEAMAFGAKKIFDSHLYAGVDIVKIYAVGGIPLKNKMMMQIYADILNRKIYIPVISNTSSSGACICASVALKNPIGTRSAFEAEGKRLVDYDLLTYSPDPKAVSIYEKLFDVYSCLHDSLGRRSSIFARLSEIQKSSCG